MPFFFHFAGNLNNDFRYNAAFLVQGDLSHLSVHLLYICSRHMLDICLSDPLIRLLVFLFRFKVLQNETWFGLTGLKGDIMRVLCIDVINIISKTPCFVFHRGFQTSRNSFYCFEVFGICDETRSTSF